MKVGVDKFRQVLQRFVFENAIPSVDGLLGQFMLGAAYGLMEEKIGEKLCAFGLTCDDGKQVDMDLLERAILHGFKASNGKVELSALGHKFKLSQEDWQAFKRMF